MKMRALIAVMVLLGCSEHAYAECAGCTTSQGVRIALKSGTQVEGYLPWNHFFIDDLLNTYDFEKHPQSRPLLGKAQQRYDADIFNRWIELVNLAIQNRLPLKQNQALPKLRLYKKLPQVNYPLKRFVAVQGQVVDIPFSDISQLAVSPSLKLSADTTGIQALPEADVQLLADKRPRFSVEVAGTVGSTVYVVYGEQVSLSDLLEHVLLENSNEFPRLDILVDRVPIRTGDMGAGPATDIETEPALERWKGACKAFLKKLGEADRAKCQREDADIYKRMERFTSGDPKRIALMDQRHALRISGCLKSHPIERKDWKSLGTPDSLREKGIIQFSYSWD